MKSWINLLGIILCVISFNVFAQQSGGGDNSGLQGACEISGGTFTGSEGGNWACCWSDWGCYGCVDGQCKVKCDTPRCRKANGMRAAGSKYQTVKGLAPANAKAPVVPKSRMKSKVVPATKMN